MEDIDRKVSEVADALLLIFTFIGTTDPVSEYGKNRSRVVVDNSVACTTCKAALPLAVVSITSVV